MSKFNENISLLNPTLFVNDENINKPLRELDENINFILNYLDGNKALLAGVYGNLWDYNQDGKRILVNGGTFDSYRKCNQWYALKELRVVNDEQIFLDETNSRCVFDGKSNNIENREIWLEREVWIPEPLRGQSLIFAIKAAPSTEKDQWTEETSFHETLAIQIIGSKEDVQTFKTVGLWENHNYYSNNSYGEKFITAYVPFNTNKETKSIKIKIFRTSNSGFLHIDKVFLGGLTIPYNNETEKYDINEIDINEYYDFENGITKVNSSTVLGHKVSETLEKIVGNDLVTYGNLNKWFKDLLKAASIFDCDDQPDATTTPSTGGNLYTNEVESICLSDDYQGVFEIDTINKVYTIKHPKLDENRINSPQVSLSTPSAESAQYSVSVTNVTDREFTVVLSGVPFESGYKLNWNLGNNISIEDIHNFLTLEINQNEIIPEPTVYPNIFNYESIA